MSAVYSFIIDAGEQFEGQARIFVKTLLATGVRPEAIVCHATARAAVAALDTVEALGVAIRPLQPFLDGRCCNKLVQLRSLLADPADYYVLCDTDLAFTRPMAPELRGNRVRAKLVNGPNPPLDILEQIRRALGIEQAPRLVPILGRDTLTYSVNCNGGIYVIPSALAPAIGALWPRLAERMLTGHADAYDGYHWLTDQISFAMTMLTLGLEMDGLRLEWNFAVNRTDLARLLTEPPGVLHYHRLVGDDGLLLPTGLPIVDGAIRKVNALSSGRWLGD